jgi:diadenylate cyclase
VIFQEELRQFFERLGVASLRRGRTRHSRSEPIDMLLSSVVDFARDHIGALIVLPGRQPIQRHIRGGIELNGQLSVPLLKSIFDPHSPGHDGAVIVEDGRVTRFATHLPLSQDFQQLAGVGTRHSAALGLAEATDALCLVVSEERGRISVAHDGRLREVNDPNELAAVLHGFMHGPRDEHSKDRVWAKRVAQHWGEIAVALILTVGLWYLFVPGSRPEEVRYQVPVTVDHLPAQIVLDKAEPASVEVTFTGPRRAFYLFDPRKLEATLDGSHADLGRETFDVTDENLRYPRELKVTEVRPDKVRLSFRRVEPAGNARSDARP